MKIQISDKKIKSIKSDLELVIVVGKNIEHRFVKDIGELKTLGFKAENLNSELLVSKSRIYIAIDELEPSSLRVACAQVIMSLKKRKFKTLKTAMYFDQKPEENLKAMIEGFLLGSYKFDKYKSKQEDSPLKKIVISTENYHNNNIQSKFGKTAKEAIWVSEGVNYVRDMVNQTPEDIDPVVMSKMAKDLAKNTSINTKVYGVKYLKDQKMGAMLAVSRASKHPAQLIHMSYKGIKAKKKIALVGKGLTFDTGGLSLKPSDGMLDMKMDKAGGCVLFGVIQAVERLALPIELHVIVGAVENAIGKHAYRPGDILKARNGKTIEVKNTDAEGRLVLADCLSYAQDLKPDYIIDIATLTGACVVALGEYTMGVMGNNPKFINEFRESATESGELSAELPFNRYLPELLKTEVADVSNLGGSKYGGAITAAMFLDYFIEKKYKNKWLHIDIAGPAFCSKAWGENPSGATGAGLRSLLAWLKKQGVNE